MTGRGPSILYVTEFWPQGASCGAQQRVLNIGRQLQRAGRVSLCLVNLGEIDAEVLARTRAEFDLRHIARQAPRPLRGFIERCRYELDPGFLNTHFGITDDADRGKMLELIGEHDVVWVHSIRTANQFRIDRWPHAILDIDDVQSRLYASCARAARGIVRKLLDFRMALIWRRRERRLKDRFSVLTVCSEPDRRWFPGAPRVHVVPNGFNPPAQMPVPTSAGPPRLGFIGPLSFVPNRTGVEWFIRKIWPEVKRHVPDARLRLVGRDSDRGFAGMGPDIDGLGYVDRAADEIATWSGMIVPIRMGGGTRVKVAEGFSRKCPVISTSLGAFGYEVTDGQELLLADNPRDFGDACVRLVRDRALAARLAENAWRKFLQKWTWDAIGVAVAGAVESCLGSTASGDGAALKETRLSLSGRPD